MGASYQRSHLQSEVSPPIGDLTSNQRSHLWSEVSPPIGGPTSNQRCHLQLEVSPPIRGPISNRRWDLQLEVGPPIGDLTSNRRSHLLEVFFRTIWGDHNTWLHQEWRLGDYENNKGIVILCHYCPKHQSRKIRSFCNNRFHCGEQWHLLPRMLQTLNLCPGLYEIPDNN